MKQIFLLISILSLNLSSKSCYTLSHHNLKQMLQGNWKLNNDNKYILCFKNSVIEHKYNGKIKERNTVKYDFKKSPKKYLTAKGAFDFTKPKFTSDFKIIEYNSLNQISDSSFVVYIDSQTLELGTENGRVTFKKIK